jgi:RNA-directed DNA polymerase
MTIGDAEVGAEMRGAALEGSGRNLREQGDGASNVTARTESSCPKASMLMEAVVERGNMMRALRRVEENKGAAGADGMPVGALKPYLREHWPCIRGALLEGRYEPQPVLGVKIPKPGGKGMRQLGIPTVVDRLIQQALHQVLQPIFDGDFSESSYGFRPGRSAHQAVEQARAHVASGRRWVVDMDLEKFFDRVNHDLLMSRVARKVEDKRVLGLIRRYLQAGMMDGGVETQRVQGTPQGGPLSPLLSNIMLDDLDKELERRGHAFCRYADDCNIYVRSRHAGERVLASLARFGEERLRLKVNRLKSAVDRPWRRKFLGYSMTFHRQPRLRVAAASIERLKGTLLERFRGGRGRNLGRFIQEELTPLLRGWANYFRLAEVKGVFEELDGWIRRKLRCILWRQWRRPYTRARNLMKHGLEEARAWRSATNGRGPWWNSGASHMNEACPKKFFDALGLVSLLSQLRRLQSTP